MTTIFRIHLPTDQDADAFVKFMESEYFPAIDKRSTRVGQVSELVLLQGNTTDTTHEFFLRVDGLMAGHEPRVERKAVLKKLESFGAQLTEMGAFRIAAHWRASADA